MHITSCFSLCQFLSASGVQARKANGTFVRKNTRSSLPVFKSTPARKCDCEEFPTHQQPLSEKTATLCQEAHESSNGRVKSDGCQSDDVALAALQPAESHQKESLCIWTFLRTCRKPGLCSSYDIFFQGVDAPGAAGSGLCVREGRGSPVKPRLSLTFSSSRAASENRKTQRLFTEQQQQQQQQKEEEQEEEASSSQWGHFSLVPAL